MIPTQQQRAEYRKHLEGGPRMLTQGIRDEYVAVFDGLDECEKQRDALLAALKTAKSFIARCEAERSVEDWLGYDPPTGEIEEAMAKCERMKSA
jgi:hypothetical protein